MRHKNRLLDHILRDANIDQCVIFTSTKAMTEVIADELYEKGFAANCLHGDMPQGWRNRTLTDLRKGRCKILVATDVAARGIDVPTITHVINYDLPKQAEDYVHRIGRTGRAGRTGIAITFAEVNEYVKVHKIEKYINRKLPELTIEGMEPTANANPQAASRKAKAAGAIGNPAAGAAIINRAKKASAAKRAAKVSRKKALRKTVSKKPAKASKANAKPATLLQAKANAVTKTAKPQPAA